MVMNNMVMRPEIGRTTDWDPLVLHPNAFWDRRSTVHDIRDGPRDQPWQRRHRLGLLAFAVAREYTLKFTLKAVAR